MPVCCGVARNMLSFWGDGVGWPAHRSVGFSWLVWTLSPPKASGMAGRGVPTGRFHKVLYR